MQVVFLHPDLGIGGAERLVVDAALALKSKGHRVSFITAHHDRAHCFEETKDGTFSINVAGDWLPRKIMGGFHAVCAYIRMIYITLYLVFASSFKPDVVFCDQISVCIPIIRLASRAKVVFYCHYPDKLLTGRESWMKWLYRKPLDWMEERTTGMAHFVLVNSHFTARIFRGAFTSLKDIETHVLHPTINSTTFDKAMNSRLRLNNSTLPSTAKYIFLSINRYERKKNLELAIKALDTLRDRVSHDDWGMTHFLMAGGYDERVSENVNHHKELVRLVENLKLQSKITFLRSVTSTQKMALLSSSTAVLYTPSNEHFGIVPVEAMYMKKPVIGVNSGGPKETILDGITGFLCKGDAESFADAMLRFVKDPTLSAKMGAAGRERVKNNFSFEKFATTLNGIIQSVAS
uniref:Alpha-1,3/1,6-mannosyltransferase ALG2 n=1 Tax=Ciona savignyi TaxID=51511 RepID=H2ZJH8_CIOSA